MENAVVKKGIRDPSSPGLHDYDFGCDRGNPWTRMLLILTLVGGAQLRQLRQFNTGYLTSNLGIDFCIVNSEHLQHCCEQNPSLTFILFVRTYGVLTIRRLVLQNSAAGKSMAAKSSSLTKMRSAVLVVSIVWKNVKLTRIVLMRRIWIKGIIRVRRLDERGISRSIHEQKPNEPSSPVDSSEYSPTMSCADAHYKTQAFEHTFRPRQCLSEPYYVTSFPHFRSSRLSCLNEGEQVVLRVNRDPKEHQEPQDHQVNQVPRENPESPVPKAQKVNLGLLEYLAKRLCESNGEYSTWNLVLFNHVNQALSSIGQMATRAAYEKSVLTWYLEVTFHVLRKKQKLWMYESRSKIGGFQGLRFQTEPVDRAVFIGGYYISVVTHYVDLVRNGVQQCSIK
ncbi:hypothetical protein CLF_101716 [Clonorchis sinensis]|uniref:Uncharacterized protein n=1 Tax=Clonorchis sinensis TaxID=79923 RepID=G7Y6E2_CLOSI|nr:hypothetical protein CLF_101716 [Clonorchis sinensis]